MPCTPSCDETGTASTLLLTLAPSAPPCTQLAPSSMAGRNRNIDMKPEGVENDVEYKRLVGDIEDMQQRQGWLAGRGAFDKTDLLYLRDSELQQRHVELHQRDTELSTFAAMRARLEAEAEAAEASGRTQPGPAIGTAPHLQQLQQPPKQQQQPQQQQLKRGLVRPLVPGVVIKPVISRGAPSPGTSLVSAAKRPKLELPTSAEASKGVAGKANAAAGKAVGNAAAATGTRTAAKVSVGVEALAGLLGDYGSDDEATSGSGQSEAEQEPPASSTGQLAGGTAVGVTAAKLPDAAALLGGDTESGRPSHAVLSASESGSRGGGSDGGSSSEDEEDSQDT